MRQGLIFILFLVFTAGFSQNESWPVKPLSEQDIIATQVIPGIDNNTQAKMMACAGNAANDNFANAVTLAVNGGSVSGTTCGTLEGGEMQGCNTTANTSVWYKFTATSTTHYIKIDHTSGGCYFGSAVYNPLSAAPTSSCGGSGPISCQSSSGGPLTHLYHLTNLTIGNTYYIQILYPSGGLCGQNATFNIGVTTANPGGNITNKPTIATCSSPGPGCFFNSPPTVNTVTSTCTSYPLAAAGYSANSVWSTVVQFTSSASWSNFSWQAIITSNCGVTGNVVWLNWTLYDCNCNQLACGNIGTLTGSGLACGTCYRLMYQMELANCSSFTTIWPYQNVPSSPQPCTALPIQLLFFSATPLEKNNKVNVEWVSVSEIDVKEYRLYRSDDGINFRQLTKERAKGGSEITRYNFEDDCCTGLETRYYRLIAVDNGGSVSFEKTIAVTIEGGKEIAKFAPNPAQETFVLTLGDKARDQETILQIFDSYGKLVKEESFKATEGFREFNIQDLPSGIYFVNVITPASGDELIKYKLIRQ